MWIDVNVNPNELKVNLPESEAAGLMSAKSELNIKSFKNLTENSNLKTFKINLNGKFGFNSINGNSYSLPPFSPLSDNSNPILVNNGDRVVLEIVNFDDQGKKKKNSINLKK